MDMDRKIMSTTFQKKRYVIPVDNPIEKSPPAVRPLHEPQREKKAYMYIFASHRGKGYAIGIYIS